LQVLSISEADALPAAQSSHLLLAPEQSSDVQGQES